MTDHDALVRAVADAPDEDTPRLAYADFLDELGGGAAAARAEFVRLQVRLARLPDDHPDRDALRRREWELWVDHRRGWRAEVPDAAGINWRGYDRGFLHVIDADAVQVFVRHAAELCRAAPVTAVRFLAAAAGDGRALADLPELVRLRELDLTGCRHLTDADAAALAGSPGVTNLRVLRLDGNRIGAAGVRALAGSRHLRAIRRIEAGPRAVTALRAAFPDAEVWADR